METEPGGHGTILRSTVGRSTLAKPCGPQAANQFPSLDRLGAQL